MKLQEILEVANQAQFATIASVNANGNPQATTVEFGVWDDKIIFDTFESSRKFTNISRDDRVALVVMPDSDTSIDIEGRANVLSGKDLALAQEAYFAKIPAACQWSNREDVAFVEITIAWARLTNVVQRPWQVEIYER